MSHISGTVIHQSILHLWDEDEYDGVREHFSTSQLARLDALDLQDTFSFFDKLFIGRMVMKLLLKAK